MKIEDVRIIGGPPVLATPDEVEALEGRLWIRFPAGYREYVTRLGEGVLGGSLVRIYPPWRIEKELAGWRRRIEQYWFWDAAAEVLPKERALECVVVGDTVNGDELVFHPARPDRLYVLPHESEQVFEAGRDLLSAVEWMCASGELVEPFAERDFEPFDSRKEAADAEEDAEGEAADPEGESLDEIIGLAKRWVERHGVRELAKKEAKPYGGKGRKLELLHESFVLAGEFPYGPGYAVAWRIVHKETGLELGVFRWHKDEASQGSAYEPNNENLAKVRGASS